MGWKFYLVRWPTGEREIVIAESLEDVFLLLDASADPSSAEIMELDLSKIGPIRISIEDMFSLNGKEKEIVGEKRIFSDAHLPYAVYEA